MKRLIKRYVLKAQVDRENDEVNEGKMSFLLNVHFNRVFFGSLCDLMYMKWEPIHILLIYCTCLKLYYLFRFFYYNQRDVQ